MIARAHIDIEATPSDVWPWLVEPSRIPRWWTKVKSFETQDGGPLREGTRFTMLQEWRNGDRTFEGEVLACDSLDRLEYRVRAAATDAERMDVLVRIRLVGFARPTRVEYESDVPWPAGLPRIFKPLLWLLVRWGEKQHLVPLKAIVESTQ